MKRRFIGRILRFLESVRESDELGIENEEAAKHYFVKYTLDIVKSKVARASCL